MQCGLFKKLKFLPVTKNLKLSKTTKIRFQTVAAELLENREEEFDELTEKISDVTVNSKIVEDDRLLGCCAV
jgi:hypothetical protein